MSFERAIAFVLEHEGGLAEHPNDAGKVTKFGISSAAHPGLDVRGLLVEEAMEIYKDEYWRPIKGDRLPQGVDTALFDYAVNSGVRHAVQALQLVLGVERDGKLGPKTLAAVRAYGRGRNLALALTYARVKSLCRLVQMNPDQVVFIGGWMRRTHELVGEIVATTL